MSGMEVAAAAASEVAKKPVSDFVDALVGPHIVRLRKWTTKRELKDKLSASKLPALFERYLRDTLMLASEVHSVVFPQRALPLEDIYEPVLLEPQFKKQGKLPTFLNAAELLGSVRHATIIDQAGMGKTTFTKYLVTRVCELTDKVPIWFQLRDYEAGEPLSAALLRLLPELGAQVGAEGFNTLLSEGRFVVVLDGFDEVHPAWQSDVRQRIEHFSVHCGGSKIILTSRPQLNLPMVVGGHSFRFRPLERKQAHSMLERYDKVSGLTVGRDLTKQLGSVPPELLDTPLLVALLYRTFGVNRVISDRVTAFYSDTYEALFRGHDLTKAGFNRKKLSALDIDDFRRMLQKVAFYCAIEKRHSWASEDELVTFIEQVTGSHLSSVVAREFATDLLVAVPFLVRDGREIRFVHKTFCEYFAAEYAVRHENSYKILTKLRDREDWRSFATVFKFASGLAPDLMKKVFTVPAAEWLRASGKLKTRLSTAETLRLAFKWWVIWGKRSQLGDVEAKLKKIGLAGYAVASRQIVVGGETVELLIVGRAIPNMDRLPGFSWLDISTPDPAANHAGDAISKLEAGNLIATLKPATLCQLKNDQVGSILKSPYLRSVCIEVAKQVMDCTDYDEMRLICPEMVARVIEMDRHLQKEADQLEDLLSAEKPHQHK